MTRKYAIHFGPALVVALGIIISAWVAASPSLWLVGAGLLLMAVSILGADLLDTWLRRQPLVPSLNGLLAAGTLLVAGGIFVLRDPGAVSMMVSVLGAGSSTIFLLKSQGRTCEGRPR